MAKKIIILTLVGLVSGCVAPYKPPMQGPIAKLEVKGENQVNIFSDPINCKGGKYLGDKSSPMVIEANKLTTLSALHFLQGPDSVIFAATFYPKANETYYIQTEDTTVKYGINKTIKTTFQIFKQVNKNGQISYVPIPMVKRKITGLMSSTCTDAEEAKRVLKLKFPE